MKKFIAAFSITLLLTAVPAHAQTVDELKQQIITLNQQIAVMAAQIEELQIRLGDKVEPAIVKLTAKPNPVRLGRSSKLKWSAKNATYCDTSNLPGAGGNKLKGTVRVTPQETTVYELTCYNSAHQVTTVSTTLRVGTSTSSGTETASIFNSIRDLFR